MGKNSFTEARLSFSKSCLFQALVRLLEDHELYEISISELTSLAGVSRSTFYRNYHQVSDIIVEFLDAQPMGFPISITPEEYSAHDVVEGYFDYLIENRVFFNLLYKRNLFHYLLDEMNKVFHGEWLGFVNAFGFSSKYEVSSFIGLVYNVTADWIAGGMQETRDEMIAISTNLITSFHFGIVDF